MIRFENAKELNEHEVKEAVGGDYNPFVYNPYVGLPSDIQEKYEESWKEKK
ncbi:MAG: hypothetical protein IJ237_09060 [Oscillospiraceae bacterium]|nr:hypothetical protein [Oscillospiraceae bacterium]